MRELRDGEPCNHKGCLSHISHPCEGCGRIAGKQIAEADTIIGMDIASKDSSDFSAVSQKCVNCNTIIHTEIFKGEKHQEKYYKVCPNCGVEFKYGIIMK